MHYQLFHLIDRSSSTAAGMLGTLQARDDVETWGVFSGLFGLGTNEAYWVVMADTDYDPAFDVPIEVVNRTSLAPTIRPTVHEPRSKTGVYVYRWFEVEPQHIEEVVRLSGEAWETFEGGFDTEVQGLFRVFPEAPVGAVTCGMVLVTWYKNLDVWQQSRAPDPEARQRFVQRQALLGSAVPIATRLEVESA